MKKDFVSLAEARPDLAKEWNYEKNGDLKPEDVSRGSKQKVWWKLPYDVPDDYPVEHLRGKHFEFEWEARINDRISHNSECPFLTGNDVYSGFNDLATVNPVLAKEWHPTKNGDLKPTQVTAGSTISVWWLLNYNVPMDYPIDSLRGKPFNFEWMSSINSRNQGRKCPFLTGNKILKGFNDLATVHPELAKEWHPTKNGDLKPENVHMCSHQKVWWYLPYDVPMDYPIESLRGKHFNFEWYVRVNDRVNYNTGCPFLAGKNVLRGFNDLATVNPKLAKEWHPTKNGKLTPCDIRSNSNQKVWWLLSYDVPMDYPIKSLRGKHFNFEWQASPNKRQNGNDCPFLSGHAIWNGFNDLATTNPNLADEWDYDLNANLSPQDVAANSSKKVWWHLSYDIPDDYIVESLRGKHIDFQWKAGIAGRNNGNGCPFLSGHAVWQGFNDLATVSPELAKEWHPIKNGDLKPTQITANSDKKVWWLLPYDVPMDYPIKHLRGKHFDFEWQARIPDRVFKNATCPYLSYHPMLWKGFNDLQTVNPKLAKEWHPTKNGDLIPEDVTCGLNKQIWWLLPYDVPTDYPIKDLRGKHFDFEWQASINHRNRGIGCPFVNNRAVWRDFNDLSTVNPNLAKEWHPTKNSKLTPHDVVAGSWEKVWWYLPYDDPKTGKHFNFEWQAVILNRNRGSGCPYLTIYKGEEYIKQYLQKDNISFNVQQKFSDLLGTGDGQLSYDFSIPDEKYGLILIEYNGIQHYEAVEYFGGEEKFKIQKEHDKRKRDYAKKHGYKLITVKYTYDTYESVEEYLDKELKKLGVINDTKKEETVNDAA